MSLALHPPKTLLTRLISGEGEKESLKPLEWADLRQLTLRSLLQAARVQWSWSHTSSLLIGSAIAWKDRSFDPVLLFWTWFGVEAIHAGVCMTNDYWDYLSGADDVGEHTIFNAGSRVIQEGKISPRLVLVLSFICYGFGAATGVFLALTRGWPILVIGLIGGVLGYLYTAPPAKLCYKGLDQLTLAICYGPLTILGSYYVQAQRFTLEVLLISLVYGITASMILYVKGFQDTESDRRAQKRSVIIALGRDRANPLFIYFFFFAYLIIALGIYFKIIPLWMLAAAGSIPFAISAHKALQDHLASGNVNTFFKMLVRTKSAHIYLGFLLIIGYVLVGILARNR